VEVTPDKIRALLGQKEIGMVDRSWLDRGVKSLLSERPHLTINPPLAPRSGLGLYVFGGSASFRFGAIDPLPINP